MNKEIIEKIKRIYEEMKEIDKSRVLSENETGDLCFYLGLDYVRKSIKELEEEYTKEMEM